jgi:tetratricopeptide (TPR) repeat protein
MTPPPDRPFKLFLSYAHSNEACKDRLKINLAPLARNGWVDVWDDRAIPAGADWRKEIEAAMAASDAAAFLLDDDFLASNFCMDVEVAAFLQRHRDDGTLILFILTDHCLWEEFDYIRQFQLLPRDAHPIVEFDPPSLAYTAIAREIKAALAQHHPKPIVVGAGLPAMPAVTRRSTVDFAGKPAPTAALSLPALLEKLPGRTPHLFGREDELAQLSDWQAHKGVFLWVAEGGMGKSALLRWWLETQDWPTATRFLGHTFYSQGSHNQASSARGFLLDALKQLGVDHALDAPDDELGRLLALEAAKQPTVLVLDGMEPLQQASGDPRLNGSVKDRGLAALLEGLARQPGEALCLASSRLPIPDAGIEDAAWFREKELDKLPPAGALALLRQRGLRGTEEELARVAERCGHHPLALVLAAEFCHTYLQDQAAAFLARPWQPKTGAEHAATVMAWFDAALAEEHPALDRELAQILGLFDRPAPWGALMALKAQEPPIPGLTEQLHAADEGALLESLARLSQWGLLQADLARPEPELDAHPLVREHFGRQLEQENPEAWRAAHGVLFDWFRGLPEKEQPDTLEELEPLYRAVGHGCKAGRYRTALMEVYWGRIQHGRQSYSQFQLAAWSSDLAALAGYFPQGWDQPPMAADAGLPGETLREADRSWLLAEASFCLMYLGRLEEALSLRTVDHQRYKETGDWDRFCRSSDNLMELLTPLGRWAETEAVSREAEMVAARIEDGEQRWQRSVEALSYLGRALHGQGRLAEARAAYSRAETVQAQAYPDQPKLYSLRGYNYAQLLMEQSGQLAGWREVLARGRGALDIDDGRAHLVRALNHCTIGLALSALGNSGAGPALARAVDTMRRAGSVLFQLPMHLARAGYLRSTGQLPAAWADHDAALAIARRGNMRTWLAECALLAGNLCLDEGRTPEAAAQYASAAQLIHEDGYGRRLTELHLLQARLLRAQRDPESLSALARAEARIREIGQWGHWRALRQVAREIGAPDPGECPAA